MIVAETASNIKDAVSECPPTIGKIGAVVSEIRKIGDDGQSKVKLAHLIEGHTEVGVARPVVYNQWTWSEMVPSITKGQSRSNRKIETRCRGT